MIRILLVEDQMIVRRGINLLATIPDIEVIGEAADGEEALAKARSLQPQVVVMDILLPKMTGIEILNQLQQDPHSPPVLLLTTFDEDPLFLQAIQAGARGFFLKDVSVERLAESIRAVAAGKTLFQPALKERVVRAVQQRGNDFEHLSHPDPLTPRKTDVLRLIAAGYSNREIGESLSLTEGSVKNHTSSVLSKLGARDRTRAVLRAIEIGYL
ncbi:MAG: response regulator transcription factor [Acidobacteria bacterium]|nr:response regulator transcription factor [Acidobacteriota bacterium]